MSSDARGRSGPLFYLAVATIPVGIFLYYFHWQILIPTNTRWLLQGDWGAAAIGWNALRHDGWRWPLGSTALLAWPHGVTVTYTDSNPLMSLLLKPFAGVLPTPFQFVGPWLFSCILLQFFVGYALLRHATEDRWLRVLGATLLTLAPTLINRIGHANLCAHWTILAALSVYLNVRSDVRRDLWFAGILLLSALIHPYFLLMNAAIWGSDVLRRAWPRLRSFAPAELIALAARSAAVAAAPIAALWATGALGGYRGEAGGFGYYSMALDALINPAVAGYSRFLPVAPQGGGQVFEGFQYLGAGLLLLVAAAALAVLASPAARERLRGMGWLAWLAPALLALLALALSDHVQLHGRDVVHVGYDWIPLHITSTFRASGRLFWPCAYVLILVALELVFALRLRVAVGVGLAAVALQFLDLTGFAAAARAQTSQVIWPERWVSTHSRKWDPLIASADVVEFQPPDPHLDGKLFYEIAWRASSLGRPVNVMYTARVKPEQKAFEAASRGRFLRGELNPRHLYIIADGCHPAGVDPARIKLVNKVTIIPPADARYPFPLRPAPAAAPFPLGQTVTFDTAAQQFRCLLAQDWSQPEGWGVWSDGAAPELIFRLPAPPARDLQLTVLAQPSPDPQGVTVVVGGRAIGRWTLAGAPAEYRVQIPRALIAGTTLRVVLKVDHPQAPSAVGASSDSRLLGVGLRAVRLDVAP